MRTEILTANVAAQSLGVTTSSARGMSIGVPASATFGAGTLTLLWRPAGQNINNSFYLLDTLTAGSLNEYAVGANMELAVTLTGATAPSIPIICGMVY
jgi:hypothetical protein